ncbi:FkbM family methyltransferase [Aurantiacibacter suaedae]|uniref:FkbM family methyltransferase n=1 Tax=Aurantiacibacter suaedae TaxID=2545755 RepID=UPI0010F65F25|nr:FkbM family methyltransferase [Aurantiacibacter suaedae]
MISYAQNFEDVLLWRALGDVENGCYLDIGAQHPVVDSVSKIFFDAGWRGVHVEPVSHYAQLLREQRPGEIVIEAVVSDGADPVTFFQFPDTGLSTGIADIAQSHIENGFQCEEREVPTVTLALLLASMGRQDVHWLKVDVEGMEDAVFRSWGDCPITPWILVIESTKPNSPEPVPLKSLAELHARGYREVCFDGLNRYFVAAEHAELAAAFDTPPNIFDKFSVSEHHFSVQSLRTGYVSDIQRLEDCLEQARKTEHSLHLDLSNKSAEARAAEAEVLRASQAHENALSELARCEGDYEAQLQRISELSRETRDILAAQNASLLRETGQILRTQLGDLQTLREEIASTSDALRIEQARAQKLGDQVQQLSTAQAVDKARLKRAAALLSQSSASRYASRRLFGMLASFINNKRAKRAATHAAEVAEWLADYPQQHPRGNDTRPTVEVTETCDHHERSEPMTTAPITSVEQLLNWHDEQFVDLAFQSVLGRAPDPEGRAYYVSRLRKGVHKLQILKQLRRSDEGRNFIPGVAGLDRAIKHHHLASLPVIGPVLASALKLEGDRPIERQIRALANETARLSQQIAHQPMPHENQHRANSDSQPLVLDRLGRVSTDIAKLEYAVKNSFSSPEREFLNEGKCRYVFNLTTSYRWRSHAVGIVRVERELARYLSNFANVEFIIWPAPPANPKILARFQVEQILAEEWCEGGSGDPYIDLRSLPDAELSRNDTYISIGLDWDHSPPTHVLPFMRSRGVEIILACYDLVPINFPEFLVREDLREDFELHILEMAHAAEKVFTISERSKIDLMEYWLKQDMCVEFPSVVVNPLASYVDSATLPPLNDAEQEIMRSVFQKGGYVLYVSSFEPRKNHKLMFDIWRDLWSERGLDCPQFVYVGMPGWGTNDLLDQIPRMAAYLGGKINWLQRVSDNLLAHLYANCSFAVFPSLYEGWGLAATEALSFGKVCIVSNNSSLCEATQNLMPSYHPLDFLGWKTEILRLLNDEEYKASLENKIRDNFKNRTWTHFGDDFVDGILLRSEK